MSASQPSEKARDAKNNGNEFFKKGEYDNAIKSFTTAIELAPEETSFYSNRSAAYLKNRDFELAEADGRKCIELNAEWAKGYSRTANALMMMKKYAEAVGVFAQGLAKDPADRVLSKGLADAQKRLAVKDDEQDDLESEGIVVGIDLGTTYSCVAVWEKDGVTIIPNERGQKTTPSYVGFDKKGKRTTGQAAKSLAPQNPKATIYDVKRIIGQTFADEGVEQDIRHFSFPVVEGANNKPMVEVDMGMHGKKQFAPEEISAMVLGNLKKVAEKYLKKNVTQAVITVPAYFNDAQRAATKAAGKIAGLDVLRIINEPTAAALSYGLDVKDSDKDKQNVLIFDLGGGTFDVSILSIESGIFEVQATGGDTRLGGEDFDNKVVEFLTQEAIKSGIPDFSQDPRAVKRLKGAVEKAKRQLSSGQDAEINVDSITVNSKNKGVNFSYKLARAQFEKLNAALFLRCIETVKRVLKDAKLKTDDIDEIVLVGGSTRIPKMQEMLVEQFNGKKLCQGLNPDEAVAYGAAVQGAILNGTRNAKTENFVLMDVTPLSLGIETTGRVMSVIIPRNTAIPCTRTSCYTTEENFQTEVDIVVYEGERLKTDENNQLGKFTISGIERAKRGEPKVDVTFALDSNGMLAVNAKDQKTGAAADIKIESRGRATDEEIARMVRDAERFKKSDEERLARQEAVNELESIIHQANEAMQEMNDKEAQSLDNQLTKVQDFLDENREIGKPSQFNMQRRTLERMLLKFNRA